jgi:predicted ester cyclase
MTLTSREAEALVRRFLTDVVDGGDTDGVGVFVTDDVAEHHPTFRTYPGDESDGATALGWTVLAGADVDVDIRSVVATNEEVAVRATVSGTHRESLLDLAPTGTSFEIAYAVFCRIEDGRIDEIWSLPDGLSLLGQLGANPEPPLNRSTTDPTEHSEP